jgi:DNA-binding XRE family transcriptional regulator
MNNKSNKIKERRKTLTYSTKELASLANVPEKDILE